jgi:hypothetical protein
VVVTLPIAQVVEFPIAVPEALAQATRRRHLVASWTVG